MHASTACNELWRPRLVYLLNERNTRFQIHAEVNELPDNAFLLVLLLLEDEHVMIEELLQTLVGVVDAQLLERVVLATNIIINIVIRTAAVQL